MPSITSVQQARGGKLAKDWLELLRCSDRELGLTT